MKNSDEIIKNQESNRHDPTIIDTKTHYSTTRPHTEPRLRTELVPVLWRLPQRVEERPLEVLQHEVEHGGGVLLEDVLTRVGDDDWNAEAGSRQKQLLVFAQFAHQANAPVRTPTADI